MNTQKPQSKQKSIKNQAPTMNEDLKRWVSAEEQVDISKTIHERLKDKKPKGKCNICRVHPAKSICIKCGSSVCSSCYFTMVGLCQNCLSKETIEKWKNKKTDWKKILEVDWVD
ncbi:MAG TPA: hypothetical protein VMY59_07885 [Candidatus Thermoplasmatota archaeon]|nr:hypothetical protein [Candidatus Thermoplasmatota archaeon]